MQNEKLDSNILLEKGKGQEVTRAELLELLKKYNVPFEKWGTGESKTIEHLLSELSSGESELIEKQGNLVRKSFGAAVNVYYKNREGKVFKLKEAKQVFRDGREKIRDLGTSIGEKIKPGESALSAAQRALSEELGIDEKLELKQASPIIKGPVSSQSFPGLQSEYFINVFEFFLPDNLYNPDGYTERQADKESIFIWEQIN